MDGCVCQFHQSYCSTARLFLVVYTIMETTRKSGSSERGYLFGQPIDVRIISCRLTCPIPEVCRLTSRKFTGSSQRPCDMVRYPTTWGLRLIRRYGCCILNSDNFEVATIVPSWTQRLAVSLQTGAEFCVMDRLM